jgi:hypothetical protein
MASSKQRALWAGVLVSMAAVAALTQARVFAQSDPPAPPIDCPPTGVLVGDLVAINLGHATAAPAAPLVAAVRLFDARGAVLLERTVTLPAGESTSVRLGPLAGNALIRGEVVPISGPGSLRLGVTMQVLDVGQTLTYGPHFKCSGDTPNRGPA